MDASIRGTGTFVREGSTAARAGTSRRTAPGTEREDDAGVPPQLAGLARGARARLADRDARGEKCLEVLCRSFPARDPLHADPPARSLSPAIESMTIQTSPLQRIPGVFRNYRHLLPLMPLAVRGWRPKDVDLVISLSHCVAKAVVPPPGVPHVCYCFTPMRYAWQGRDAYLESWSDRPVRLALARTTLSRLRRWDRATASRVTHFVAISETVRQRIARCYRRDSRVIQPPVDVEFYAPGDTASSRDHDYLVVSALVPYKRIDQAVLACTQSGRPLTVIGEGPERARLEAMAGPSVRFLGWQPDEVIRDHYRRCRALLFPGEEDFGIVPDRGPGLRGSGGRSGTRRRGRDRRRPCRPNVPRADRQRPARCARSLGGPGQPHRPGRARRRALALSLPVFRERIHKLLVEVVTRGGRHPCRRPRT